MLLLLVLITGTVQAGLVAYYPFNGNANDESGNGNNGTSYGATQTTDRFGNANSAYSFDGSGDYIDVPNAPSLNPTDAITITAWFKADSFALGSYSWPNIVRKSDNDGTKGYTMEIQWVYENRPSLWGAVYLKDQGWLMPIEPFQLPVAEDTWYFAASVFDGLTLTNYLRSMDQTSFTTAQINGSGNIVPSSNNLWIGNAPIYGDRSFDGIIDDVRIYNRALTTDEVIEVYSIPEPVTILLLTLGGIILRRKR